jgi:hypothetical protein
MITPEPESAAFGRDGSKGTVARHSAFFSLLLTVFIGSSLGVIGILGFQRIVTRGERPNDKVDTSVAKAKANRDNGDTESAIAALATALSVEGATNKDEAMRLLKDIIVSQSSKNSLLEALVKPKAPAWPWVEPKDTWTIEDLMRAYVQAPTWQHKLPFIIDSNKARPLMAEHYAAGYQAASSFTIRPPTRNQIAVGETTRIGVDLPGSKLVMYVVVRNAEGYRIDWIASRAIWFAEQEANYRKSHGLVDAVLQIQVLNVKQANSFAELVVRVTNRSDAYLSYWQIDCEVHDNTNKYLSHKMKNGTNLASHGSTVITLSFSDTHAANIKGWAFKLGGVSIDDGGGRRSDVTKLFTVSEKK